MGAIAGRVLEAVVEIDPNLLTVEILEELSHHGDFSVCSSAAVILFTLACMLPGTVPLDITTGLARPAHQDWYMFTPLNTLKQLALTRPEAVAALVDLADSPSRDEREYAAAALNDSQDSA